MTFDLQKVRALLAKASPPPWHAVLVAEMWCIQLGDQYTDPIVFCNRSPNVEENDFEDETPGVGRAAAANAELVVELVNNADSALAEIERLRRENALLHTLIGGEDSMTPEQFREFLYRRAQVANLAEALRTAKDFVSHSSGCSIRYYGPCQDECNCGLTEVRKAIAAALAEVEGK